MDATERLNFFTELSEALQEINELFEDHGVDPPHLDCDDEDCELPADEDVVNIRQLLRDSFLIVLTNIRQ